jgi:hypothetical protein
MRIDIRPALRKAIALECLGIGPKSWHNSVTFAHECLQAMPSPAWHEAAPGISQMTGFEHDANKALNGLRAQVMLWLVQLIDPRRSWEASDSWPEPEKLRDAIEALRQFAPPDEGEPVDCSSCEEHIRSQTGPCSQPSEVRSSE